MTRSSMLAKAMKDKLIVRFSRRFEPGWVEGFVLDIGPRFFLLAEFGDGFWLNGFGCFRLEDVRGLSVPCPYADVKRLVMKLRAERIPKKLRIDLSNVERLLLSANKAFPLVTIHREKVDLEVCHIGRVTEVARGQLSLLEIGPDGEWDEEPETYRLSEITLVEFGGDYEDGLALVGGLAERKRGSSFSPEKG